MNYSIGSIEIVCVLSLDEAIYNGMSDDDSDIIIYKSPLDEDGDIHAISATVWRKDGIVSHSFQYVLICEDDHETQESALDPLELIEELPVTYQKKAGIVVQTWLDRLVVSDQ